MTRRMSLLRRFLRPVSAAGISALALITLAFSPLPAAADPSAPSATDALADFGSCLTSEGKGSIVLLVDQSGSMRKTDPGKSRVEAGKHLITRLAALGSRSEVAIDMRVAGFAAEYQTRGEWTPVDGASQTGLISSLEALGDDLRNYDTDYWMALEGARRDLDEHVKDRGCKAIVWITDGDYEVDVRDDANDPQAPVGAAKPYADGAQPKDRAAAEKILTTGKSELCRNTGLADQLRNSHITLLGIGLTQGSPDFTFVKRIIKGGGANAGPAGVQACGQVSDYPGEFFEVGDFDSLLIALDAIAEGKSPEAAKVPVCQGAPCDTVLDFVLDESLDRVHIMATANKEGLDAFLLPPGSTQPIPIPNGKEGEQNGIQFTWHKGTNPGTRTLEMNLSPQGSSPWAGQWKLGFIDKSSSSNGEQVKVFLYLSSTALIDWPDKGTASFVSGEKTDGIRLVALDKPGGKAFDVKKLPGKVVIEVTLKDAKGHVTKMLSTEDKAALEAPLPLDLTKIAVGQAELTTSLRITTADITAPDGKVIKGTELLPSTSRHIFAVILPDEFPTIGSDIDFGVLENQSKATASLKVTGPGCVWVDTSSMALTGGPADSGGVSLTSSASSADTCVKLSDGATVDLPLDLTVGEPSNAALTGTVTFMLAPEGKPDKAVEQQVSFKAELRKPVNVPLAIGTFIGVLLTGIAIPLALLYLFKALSSRVPAGPLSTAVIEVEIPDSGVLAPLSVESSQRPTMHLHSRAKKVEIQGYTFRARMSLLPSETGWVELDHPAPSVSGSTPAHRNGKACLPLGLRGQWVAVLDKQNSPTTVTLIVIAASATDAEYEQILRSATDKLRSAVAQVSDHLVRPQGSQGGDGNAMHMDQQGGSFIPTPAASQDLNGFIPSSPSMPSDSGGFVPEGPPSPYGPPPTY